MEWLQKGEAILVERIRTRNRWLADKAMHTHGPDCRRGRVCVYADHKEPLLPTLIEVLEKLA